MKTDYNSIRTTHNTIRHKRALNFLGSALKFITGILDHDEAVRIGSTINKLIRNNELTI